MTAEFALTVPVVCVVVAMLIGGLFLGAQRAVLAASTAQIALHEARGDTAKAAQLRSNLPAGATVSLRADGALLCADGALSLTAGPLRAITARTSSCAAVTEEDL